MKGSGCRTRAAAVDKTTQDCWTEVKDLNPVLKQSVSEFTVVDLSLPPPSTPPNISGFCHYYIIINLQTLILSRLLHNVVSSSSSTAEL